MIRTDIARPLGGGPVPGVLRGIRWLHLMDEHVDSRRHLHQLLARPRVAREHDASAGTVESITVRFTPFAMVDQERSDAHAATVVDDTRPDLSDVYSVA